MSADMVSKPAPNKDLSKSAKKNAARKAKRAADQQLKGESGSSGIQLAQNIAKVKITAEDASPKAVKSCVFYLLHWFYQLCCRIPQSK
jgi:hypothetical protein